MDPLDLITIPLAILVVLIVPFFLVLRNFPSKKQRIAAFIGSFQRMTDAEVEKCRVEWTADPARYAEQLSALEEVLRQRARGPV